MAGQTLAVLVDPIFPACYPSTQPNSALQAQINEGLILRFKSSARYPSRKPSEATNLPARWRILINKAGRLRTGLVPLGYRKRVEPAILFHKEEYIVLAIRLARIGKKKKPFYRVVVLDKRKPRNGRTVEVVGTYDPLKKPAEIKLDAERIKYWLGCGAQPSDTVRSFLHAQKIA